MLKKVFRQMLLTQIISAMTVMICMLIDSIMIGRFLGVDSMTAYGLASPVLLVFAAFGSMLSAGIQVVCGRLMGSGDSKGMDACYSTSLAVAASIALIGLVLVVVFSAPLCTLLGAGEAGRGDEVFRLTQGYLRGFIIGAPAFILAQIMVPYMQIAGRRSTVVAAVLAMTVGDVLFDVLNVFVFRGGTFGMGLASSLSYYIAIAIGGIYFLKPECIFKFSKNGITRALARQLFAGGIPTVVNQISTVLLVFVLNRTLLVVGQNNAVAAYSVITSVANICYCFGAGIGSVALTLSSIFYNDEDRSALYDLVRIMCGYALRLTAAVIAAVLLTAPLLTGLFIDDDPRVLHIATVGLRLFSLSLAPAAFNTALKNFYQGIGRTRFSELISVMQNFLFTALFAVLLSAGIGTNGVWIGYILGECTTLLIISLVVWRYDGRTSVSADIYSMLPGNFGVPERDCMEASILNLEDTVAVSGLAADFCRAHGDTERNSMLISLFIEEIAANIVTHGFTKDTNPHSIDLRVFYKDGSRVIRVRDNCTGFDPVNYMELHSGDDPTSHFGIRIVMEMAKEAYYMNSLGLNNLTLIL